MFVDARKLPSGTSFDAEICIVGGGAAGITLALEFERCGIATCVLEGGQRDFTRTSQTLYKGENAGLPYTLRTSRTRQLGGSSNCWGGWIRQFLPIDFETRDWMPNSGWPLDYTEVASFYPRANRLVQVNDHDFDPHFWYDRLDHNQVKLLRLRGGSLETMVNKFSPPTHFGYAYERQLAEARAVKVLLNANVTEIATCDAAATVTGVHFDNGARQRFFVRARQTILAAGGIENARLMLLSNRVDHRGLGNRHDVVGRYFMEHPRVRIGRMVSPRDAAGFRFYDTSYTYHNPSLAVDGTSSSAYVGLVEKVQREEKLVQCRTYFRACWSGEDRELTEDFHDVWDAVRWRLFDEVKPGMLASVARRSPRLIASLLYRRLKLAARSTYFQVESIIEPVPDRESRVTLSALRDRFGLNQARLDWRIGDLEKKTLRRMMSLVKQEFEASDIGQIDLQQADEGRLPRIYGCDHHMGTTRMHTDPRLGVVDADCKVHGMQNLYIAGSSVFPTCGNDMPTLTIVALALRLADHVVAQRGLAAPTRNHNGHARAGETDEAGVSVPIAAFSPHAHNAAPGWGDAIPQSRVRHKRKARRDFPA
jgi:choline dehydrogenase-like flavoprotein